MVRPGHVLEVRCHLLRTEFCRALRLRLHLVLAAAFGLVPIRREGQLRLSGGSDIAAAPRAIGIAVGVLVQIGHFLLRRELLIPNAIVQLDHR